MTRAAEIRQLRAAITAANAGTRAAYRRRVATHRRLAAAYANAAHRYGLDTEPLK